MVTGLSSLLRKTMVIDSLNLKLRQIARFSSNVILDEPSSANLFFLIAQHEERPVYHIHMLTSLFTVFRSY